MTAALASLGHQAASALSAAVSSSKAGRARARPTYSPAAPFTPAAPRRSASLGLAAAAVADGMFGDGMAMPAFKFVRPDVPLLSSDSEEEDGGAGSLAYAAGGPISAWPRRGALGAGAPDAAFLPPRSALERASYETNKSLSGGASGSGSAGPRWGGLLGFLGL